MKKLFFFLTVITLIASCNSTKPVAKFFTNHNFQEEYVIDPETGHNKFHASIDSLYDYTKVAELCDTADVTFHISRGSIVVDADCSGAGETLLSVFKKLLANIQFNK